MQVTSDGKLSKYYGTDILQHCGNVRITADLNKRLCSRNDITIVLSESLRLPDTVNFGSYNNTTMSVCHGLSSNLNSLN